MTVVVVSVVVSRNRERFDAGAGEDSLQLGLARLRSLTPMDPPTLGQFKHESVLRGVLDVRTFSSSTATFNRVKSEPLNASS